MSNRICSVCDFLISLFIHRSNNHIAEHGVHPEEVEEVCFGRALVQQAKSLGANPVYYVLGQTEVGRYLFSEPVFERQEGTAVTIRLRPEEAEVVQNIAKSRDIEQTALIRQWVLEKIHEQ